MEHPWYETYFGRDYARYDSHPNTRKEVRLITDVLREDTESILDLACGAGRHTHPLAKSGYDVTALDRSNEMLKRARRKKTSARFVKGDMRSLPFEDGSFDAVVSMFSSIGYFENEFENFRVLSEISRVLAPGGRVVIDHVNRDYLIRHFQPQSWFTHGGLMVVESREFDLVTCRSELDVGVFDGTDVREYHHSIRLYTAAELAMLLASVGIDTLDVMGDFDGQELSFESPRLILIGERRSEE